MYRTLYSNKAIPAAVRIKLIDLLTSLHAIDREGTWSTLTQRKKKKQSVPDGQKATVKQVLVLTINDGDHAVRMHAAKAITSLFIAGFKDETYNKSRQSISTCGPVVLLNRKGQEDTFQEVMNVLHEAYIIADGLDELSNEDESVNRMASRIYSLLLEGCVSPVCERKVISELILAVGCGHIDSDLVRKVRG